MHRKILVVAMLLALVGAVPSVAAGLGRIGADERAAMYAIALNDGGRPIQILRELCRPPRRQTACHAMTPRLRHAIEDAVDRPITWVREQERGLGVFWVLGPIGQGEGRAWYRYHWREPGAYGCTGSGSRRFRWLGSWVEAGGGASVGCPAT